MTRVASIILLASAPAWAATIPERSVSSPVTAERARVCVDLAHGQRPLVEGYAGIATKIGAEIVESPAAITAASLAGCRLIVLRVPQQEITPDEREAVVAFVRQGGSLLLAVDEERRAPLVTTAVNALIEAFGLRLTADTPYRHNNGAIAAKGAINAADRELPFSGGRAVEGGTPFAWQLDETGKRAEVFAASTIVEGKGRVVVLGEGMATLLLGTAEGVRGTGVPRDAARTTYWGKDSAIFMEELLTWLIR